MLCSTYNQYIFIEKLKYLPINIVNHILPFTGKLIFRHGKYMNQLSTADTKYDIVRNTIRTKISYAKQWMMFGPSVPSFYLDISLTRYKTIFGIKYGKQYGIIYDYYCNGHCYMVSFYTQTYSWGYFSFPLQLQYLFENYEYK